MSNAKKKPQPHQTAQPAAEPAADATKRRFPKVDPGLATITASTLALIGTIVTVSIRASGGDSSDSVSAGTVTTIVVEASTDSSADAGSTTAVVTREPAGPVVQLLGTLSADDRTLVEGAADQLLLISERLPLIVDDDFTTDDYAWPEGDDTASGGVTCTWQQLAGRYDTSIRTGNGPSWCSNGLTKTAADFALTLDLVLGRTSASDVGVLFRVSEDGTTYYDLRFNPQTQLFWFSFVSPDGTTQIIPSTFAAEILKTGANRVTVLALQGTLALFINDTLVASITGAEYTFDAGRILVLLQLNEPKAQETLSLTHFELRGS